MAFTVRKSRIAQFPHGTLFLPMVIAKGVFLKDIPAAKVGRNLLPLVVIAAATLSAASWLFRRRME